jgi:DNA-binding NarL/FixJ family response regulator
MELVLADAQTLVRAGIRQLIESRTGARVSGEAADGQHLLELAGRLHPDAVITEIGLPVMSGLEALAQMRRHYPQIPVLLLSAQATPHNVRTALRLGAAGFVVKDGEPAELDLAISALQRRQTYLSPRAAQAMLERRHDAAIDSTTALTARQHLALIAQGKATKEIASLMGVSVKTVETHRARAMQSLGIVGMSALMRYALNSGLEAAGA